MQTTHTSRCTECYFPADGENGRCEYHTWRGPEKNRELRLKLAQDEESDARAATQVDF